MDPKRYREILKGIQLDTIALRSLKAHIHRENMEGSMKIELQESAAYRNAEDGFEVSAQYVLIGKSKRRIALRVDCTYDLFFTSEEEINDEFFEIYKEFSLPLNLWPFFRELVYSITSRMNIPPLTLPLLKR